MIGNRIINVPDQSGSFWLTKRLESGVLSGLELGGGAFYAASRAVDNMNTFLLPGYTQVDGLVAYGGGPWRLALNLRNITDERYFDSSGFAVYYPGPPRQVFLSLNWRGN